MTMSPIDRNFDEMKHQFLKLGCRGWKGVETTSTWPLQQHLPCCSVLNKKIEMMKYNVSVIVKSKTIDRDEVLVCGGNMQNFV
jgi:hypothetical protein